MPILYPVKPGTIILCNYDTGFREPEMVKRRPVVVISPQHQYRNMLCTVVPLSTTRPIRDLPYVHRLLLSTPLPEPFSASEMWVKADMLATVTFQRLDLIRTKRDQQGKRRYLQPKIAAEDLKSIQQCILYALGMNNK